MVSLGSMRMGVSMREHGRANECMGVHMSAHGQADECGHRWRGHRHGRERGYACDRGRGRGSGHVHTHGRGQRVVGVGVRREEPHRTV